MIDCPTYPVDVEAILDDENNCLGIEEIMAEDAGGGGSDDDEE